MVNSKKRIQENLAEIRRLLASVERDASALSGDPVEDSEMTTDEVVDLFGISKRQLISFRARGLRYTRSKPAKYLASDITAYLNEKGYRKTASGWSNRKKG